jgi:hypothetical protein
MSAVHENEPLLTWLPFFLSVFVLNKMSQFLYGRKSATRLESLTKRTTAKQEADVQLFSKVLQGKSCISVTPIRVAFGRCVGKRK